MEAICIRDDAEQEVVQHMTATHCPYCALQCGMNLVREGGAINVAPREFPTNKGGLCQKGWTAQNCCRVENG
jgi:anaerobic selenocysteine-containing dehydrogenase